MATETRLRFADSWLGAAGDDAGRLLSVAAAAATAADATDTPTRLGGDERIVGLPSCFLGILT